MVSLLQHVRAIILLPVMVTIVIPAVLLWRQEGVAATLRSVQPLATIAAVVGTALTAAGLVLLIQTVRLLARRGKGTLAPWNPTQRLVVTGVYRHTRNPMITGVLLILLGESVGFLSSGIAIWFTAFLAANLIYMPLLEEPDLVERFGAEYELYKLNVPRWIPRLSPWVPPDPGAESRDRR